MDFPSRLLLFLEVVELGSFVKVAEQRNVNRSVISKQINRLESELGVRLLNRTTRSLAVTAAGTEMIEQAKSMRSLLNNTQRLAQNYHAEPRGILRIASSVLFGRQYVQQAVSQFQKQYPEVEIELRLEDRFVDIIGERFDLGFRSGSPKNSNLISKKIARNRLLIVAAPEFMKQHGEITTIQQLESLPAAVYKAPGVLSTKFSYFDSNKNIRHFQLNAAYKVNDLEMLKQSALSGNMLAVVTAQMIENEVVDGKLIPLMTHLKLDDFGTIYAVYPHRDAPIKTVLFMETIKSIIGEEVPNWESNIPHFDGMYAQKKNR